MALVVGGDAWGCFCAQKAKDRSWYEVTLQLHCLFQIPAQLLFCFFALEQPDGSPGPMPLPSDEDTVFRSKMLQVIANCAFQDHAMRLCCASSYLNCYSDRLGTHIFLIYFLLMLWTCTCLPCGGPMDLRCAAKGVLAGDDQQVGSSGSCSEVGINAVCQF